MAARPAPSSCTWRRPNAGSTPTAIRSRSTMSTASRAIITARTAAAPLGQHDAVLGDERGERRASHASGGRIQNYPNVLTQTLRLDGLLSDVHFPLQRPLMKSTAAADLDASGGSVSAGGVCAAGGTVRA